MRRTLAACLAAGFAAALIAACGGSPNGPGPVNQGPPVTTPPGSGSGPNQAPAIEALAVSSERAEVDSDVTVTASVKDAETPIDELAFEWKADAGTFTGQGASVKWRAPKDLPTPTDYTVTLTVTETYGLPDATGKRPQNVSIASSPAIRVHNSSKELGDMSLRFLSDFANSSVPASTCIREFSDSCRGKADERKDIEDNRLNYQIVASSLTLKNVTVAPSRLTANIAVACSFTSRIKSCSPGKTSCVVGSTEKVAGDCLLTGVYEQKRWWLCDSSFSGELQPSMRGFFGAR